MRRVRGLVLAVVATLGVLGAASFAGGPASAVLPCDQTSSTLPNSTLCTATTEPTTTTTAPPPPTTATTAAPDTTTTVEDTTTTTADTTTTVDDTTTAPPDTTTVASGGDGPATTAARPAGGAGEPPAPAGPPSDQAVSNQLAAVVPIPPNVGLQPITIDGSGIPLPTDVVNAGVRSTQAVIDALGPHRLDPALLARVLAPFPVVGPATYTDQYPSQQQPPPASTGASPATTSASPTSGAPTTTAPPPPPLPPGHEGVDILAAGGTPVLASDAGTVHLVVDPAGIGKAVVVVAGDGTEYRYLHLDQIASTLVDGQHVLEADIIGTVGNQGPSETTGAHLHFEIHPHGGDSVNPVPYLDKWVTQALETAKSVGQKARAATADPNRQAAAGRLRLRPATKPAASNQPLVDVLPGLAIVGFGSWWIITRRRRARAAAAAAAPGGSDG